METMNECDGGFVKIYRSLAGWEWYDDIPTKVVWLHCLIKANWQDKKWHGQTIKRGSFITSTVKLAEETCLSRGQVRRALDKLKSTGEITVKTTNKWTAITVEKYDKYQVSENASDHQATNKRPSNGHQTATTKENKENKEIKNNIYKGFRPPSMEELEQYISEKNLTVDAETFMDYYTANGWKVGNKTPMKDWRATARNWHRRDGGKTVTAMAKSAKAKQEQAKREAELEAEWQKEFDGRPRAGGHDIKALREKYGIGRS